MCQIYFTLKKLYIYYFFFFGLDVDIYNYMIIDFLCSLNKQSVLEDSFRNDTLFWLQCNTYKIILKNIQHCLMKIKKNRVSSMQKPLINLNSYKCYIPNAWLFLLSIFVKHIFDWKFFEELCIIKNVTFCCELYLAFFAESSFRLNKYIYIYR